MAKQISQQTFDDVVRENMQEFEMAVQEAIDDAVQQFESQGVNLSFIVKDSNLYGSEGDSHEHPIVTAIKGLKECLEGEEGGEGEITPKLQTIKSECDLDLSRKLLAGKNDGYQVLMTTVAKYKSNLNVLKSSLSALCSLCNGQPDLLEEKSSILIIDLLQQYCDVIEVLEIALRLIRYTCMKHEGNRQSYVTKNLVPTLVSILTNHKTVPVLVKETCACLRVLTYDDDIRVPFGKAHEHAKLIVMEDNGLKTVLDVCQGYTEDTEVLSELFLTLSKLVVRDEFCKQVMDMGGLSLIIKALQDNMGKKALVLQGLGVIQALAGNDDVKVAVVAAGGIELVLIAMTKHQANPQIAEIGCSTLATLMLRLPAHCAKVMQGNGHLVVIQAMKIHKDAGKVQNQACLALRNLVVRTEENCEAILRQGAEELILQAIKQHETCRDNAKAALRDLGCKVDLQERWKGENPRLER